MRACDRPPGHGPGNPAGTGIPVLNIDLIYGIDGQAEESRRYSLRAALGWQPEEINLYPLYVRPRTGLSRRERASDAEWDAQRLRLYCCGRDLLRAEGYEQVSMRIFRRPGAPARGPGDHACRTDGMIGLGCGARSYTSRPHYSFDYAVDMGAVRTAPVRRGPRPLGRARPGAVLAGRAVGDVRLRAEVTRPWI
jgi:oxygen-independent coproporphyrinogen-3 oxidase